MNKLITAVVFCLLGAFRVQAQQIPLFTQYREAQGVINPASINYDFFTDRHKTSFGASMRRQWTEISNAPTTQILRGEHFMADRNGVSLLAGGYLMNDQTGPTGFTGVYGRFATVFTSDATFNGLSVGLSAGAVQYRIKTSEIKLHDPNDIRALTDRMQIYPDIGAGIFYYQRMDGVFDEDYFYAGVSVPQLMGLDIQFANDNSKFSTRRVQHYFANVGWYHFINDNSFIEPSAWVKYTPDVPFNIDLNVRYQMASSLWVGVGTSLKGKIHAETGVILGKAMGMSSNFKIGYGFDYSFQSYGPYVGTTHEFNLGFSF
jgi:type IX secretion system PorP/SprF family membrane protein